MVKRNEGAGELEALEVMELEMLVCELAAGFSERGLGHQGGW